MQHITGIPRNQMTFASLEDTISLDNPILFIDAFVENIDLRVLGFYVNFGIFRNFFMRAEKHAKTNLVLLHKKKRTINPLDMLSKFFTISA